MYKSSAQMNHYMSRNGLPSPENTNTSDSEADIVDLLDRKRRELDDEIAKFKAVKDREFREFERDLRSRRRNQGYDISPSKRSTTSANTSPLSLLCSTQNGTANGWTAGHRSKREGNGVGEKITKATAPLSKPTLSLDKLNITGESVLPTHGSLSTPPTPSFPPRGSLSSDASSSSATITPPRHESTDKGPPTPAAEKTDSFAGVFTPVYLPLLESQDRPPFVRSPQALTSDEEGKKQIQLHEKTKCEAERQRATLIESSHSLPEQPVSPTVIAAKRTRSAPLMSSSASASVGVSRPSALRTTSGGHQGHKYKKKHVMFQLADSKVVEPSSSYEESPVSAGSPSGSISSTSTVSFQQKVEDVDAKSGPGADLDPNLVGVNGHGRGHMHGHETRGPSQPQPSEEQLSPRSASGSANAKSKKSPSLRERRRGKAGQFLSPMPSPLPSPAPSPTIAADTDLLASAEESGFSGGLTGADDGGSGVGFFELDEELASPGLRDRPMQSELEELEMGMGMDVDSQLGGDGDGQAEGRGRGRGRGGRGRQRGRGRGGENGDDESSNKTTMTAGSFTSGSVPIDIVRPTGPMITSSWIGSFGH
ncbi:hypothetical protein PV08_05724 [Exophiala spinifera]|uniref:Uncharacterized protein n=1 Tax=Exophiala spinifera TaxID=91928 RepID=A0A0D2BAQ6_9EURO|nr:uncharacterized protein PV08_05724 [Exophiala spinifera]KIW15675.1 hypothetical protein PV08_05724 [Exophiala spinifera]